MNGSVTGSFSNRSALNDLAAPGVDMTVAVPTALGGYRPGASGTSFSAPLVAGAAAWVWTVRPELDNTQLFELMRRSALDLGPAGFDEDTGFGLLSVPAALVFPAPVADPLEPNEDIEYIKPDGYFSVDREALTRPGREQTALGARLDRNEDPHDVYRIWLPPKKVTSVTLAPDADVNLAAWGPGTISVHEAVAGRIAASARLGLAAEVLSLRNSGATGSFVYLDAFLGLDAQQASYTLAIATKALPKAKAKPKPKPTPRRPAQR